MYDTITYILLQAHAYIHTYIHIIHTIHTYFSDKKESDAADDLEWNDYGAQPLSVVEILKTGCTYFHTYIHYITYMTKKLGKILLLCMY